MTQTPSVEDVRAFVLAGHGSLEKVQQMLADQPALLCMRYEWKPGDTETALEGASHVGNRAIAEFLLSQGETLTICTAAMLGQVSDVERLLHEDPARIQARGAHGIPLMSHAAWSGSVELAQLLVARGASEGMSSALSNAVSRGHLELARWLLEHTSPDLAWKNFQEKTALEIATERGDEAMMALLKAVSTGKIT
ncbi:MAG: ankyrin repeat domain-containing protein [Chloroflexaceae bacterium]|nr:ankyrin repeat domain-containing protein [Chloroflexaceae bacterium]